MIPEYFSEVSESKFGASCDFGAKREITAAMHVIGTVAVRSYCFGAAFSAMLRPLGMRQ